MAGIRQWAPTWRVAPVDDEQTVKAFLADGANSAFRDGLGIRRLVTHLDGGDS
jgi:hypothetical protein